MWIELRNPRVESIRVKAFRVDLMLNICNNIIRLKKYTVDQKLKKNHHSEVEYKIRSIKFGNQFR